RNQSGPLPAAAGGRASAVTAAAPAGRGSPASRSTTPAPPPLGCGAPLAPRRGNGRSPPPAPHRQPFLSSGGGRPILGEQAARAGLRDRLEPRADAELGEDRRDVVGDGALGEVQGGGDRRVRRPGGDLLEHLLLAPGQPGRVGERRAASASRAARSSPGSAASAAS